MTIAFRMLAGILMAGVAGPPAGQLNAEGGVPPSDESVRVLLRDGRYEQAEEEARDLVSRLEEADGQISLRAARGFDLLVEALVGNGKGSMPETAALAERAIRVKEALDGIEAEDLVPSLQNLGAVRLESDDYPSAIASYERAVAIAERIRGPNDVSVARGLDGLARALTLSERYDGAGKAVARALSIKETRLSSTDADLAATLEIEAELLQRQGQYAEARGALDRALSIREIAGPDHPALAHTLTLLGDQLWLEGNLSGAQTVYRRAADLAEKVLRPDHRDLATYLQHQALAVGDLGDLATALSLRRRALAIAERSFPSDAPALATFVNDLAGTFFLLGDYGTARPLYERALESYGQRFGLTSQPVATEVYNLAVLDTALGDFREARREYTRALDIWTNVFGAGHPTVALAHFALADVFSREGRDTDARTHYERALAIREQALGPDHPDVAYTLSPLAVTVARLGNLPKARALSTRAVGVLERAGLSDAGGFANALLDQAEILERANDRAGARDAYRKAIVIHERILGSFHPQVAEAKAGLALALARLGDRSESFETALDAEGVSRDHLRLSLQYLPERQALTYAATRPKSLDLALTLAGQPDEVGAVFDAVVRNRALVLDEMAARQQDAADADRPEVKPLWDALVSARQRLANLVVRGPSDRQPRQYAGLVEDARREKERAERALAAVSVTFRSELARAEIGAAQVREALPPRSALVAFVRYDRASLPGAAPATVPSASSRRTPQDLSSYLAFVVRPDGAEVSNVPLGAAAEIDAAVGRWRDEMTGIVRASSLGAAERAYRTAGNGLRRLVWDPLAPHLQGATTVFVVPDGRLNLVSLTALPVAGGRYLVDEGPVIHYVSAERDLVGEQADAVGRGLLAVGGPAFDDASLFAAAPPAARQSASGAASASRRGAADGSCLTLQSVSFAPLDGSRREAAEIASVWSGSPALVLDGREASEAAFKRDALGRRVLHLATHGFFLGDGCTPATAGTRSVGGLTTRPSTRAKGQPAVPVDNPLLLSGLALAGANRRALAGPRDEDGILTAEEVAALNLDEVEWAVLSACDTGLGEVRAGEGVLGLRRAFRMAGVRTVIMSLWSVEDEATRRWMRALYEARFTDRLDTAQAVHRASLAMLNQRRASDQSTHPFYWAAFVADGAWR